jgi:predicted AlkP superfamily phosphohydrolase/phosphomutase
VTRRLVVFGIDGGTLNIIGPMLEEGRLPNLTAPAWATFLTALNPGRHGVYDFLAPPRLGYNRRVQNASALAAPRVLDALSEAGRTVGAVNVPMTFPPRAVNGFVIPGMLTPAVEARYFYPRPLADDVKRIGDYYIDMNPANFEEGRDDEFVEDLYRVAKARKKVALALWLEKKPDFFAVIFTAGDRLMHFFWDRPELVRDHYEWLDGALGEFRAAAAADVTFVVMSDHGFGPATGECDLAAHLGRHGFMKVGEKGGPSPRRFMDAAARLDVLNLRKFLPRRWRDAARGEVMDRLSAFAAVDWRATRAFPGTATQYGVYLNVAGREPAGIVARADYENVREELIASFDELYPGMAARALRREEVYHGPALDDAPDVYIPLWEEGVRLREFSDDPAVAPRRRRPGEHRREGIFFAAGPEVAAGGSPADAGLADLYPTIMHLMGEAAPAGVDGRVLTEVVAHDGLAAEPPRYRDYGAGEAGYVGGEDAAVRARLRGMGYID